MWHSENRACINEAQRRIGESLRASYENAIREDLTPELDALVRQLESKIAERAR